MPKIHPMSMVSPEAQLAENVEIGHPCSEAVCHPVLWLTFICHCLTTESAGPDSNCMKPLAIQLMTVFATQLVVGQVPAMQPHVSIYSMCRCL